MKIEIKFIIRENTSRSVISKIHPGGMELSKAHSEAKLYDSYIEAESEIQLISIEGDYEVVKIRKVSSQKQSQQTTERDEFSRPILTSRDLREIFFQQWIDSDRSPSTTENPNAPKKILHSSTKDTAKTGQKSINDFSYITSALASLLEHKNANYGNAALEPLDIFGDKHKLGKRLDEKLARVKNSKELRKNDVVDIMGYLVLLCKENQWTNFDDLKD